MQSAPAALEGWRAWIPVTAGTALALVVWFGCVFASHELAQGVAALPQSNQGTWVAISNWLPAIPVCAAILIGARTLIRQRQWRSAALAGAWGFLWFSAAVLILAIPKPN
jgi:hypothetical protein